MTRPSPFLLLLTAIVFSGVTLLRADIVKLKDGTKYEGKITLQTADLIKIEVAITDRIKETKTIGMADVADIIKTAPDDEQFAKLQSLVPTRSMLSAEQYRSMIRTGPEAFLTSFAGSKHKEKVEEIKATLEEELDKVERGYIKLEGEWYSPQDKLDYEDLLQSKITLLKMKSLAQRGGYTNFIGAMREYETLEENYYGTPAFAEAVSIAQNILPLLGRQIQALRRDVDVKNREWEANKNALQPQDRQRVEAARAREEAALAAAVDADKKAKIKWTRVNPRSPENLDSYLSFVGTELNRIKGYDVEALRALGDALVEVDRFLAADDLSQASLALKKASDLPSGTSGKRGSKKSSSYTKELSNKLKEKTAARKAAERAAEEAKKSEALTRELQVSQETTPEIDVVTNETTQPQGESGEPMTETKAPEENLDAFAALATTTAPKKEETGSSGSSTKPKKKPSTREPREPRDYPQANTGGGFPFQLLVPILTVLLIAAVVVMKVLGIGGKKAKE